MATMRLLSCLAVSAMVANAAPAAEERVGLDEFMSSALEEVFGVGDGTADNGASSDLPIVQISQHLGGFLSDMLGTLDQMMGGQAEQDIQESSINSMQTSNMAADLQQNMQTSLQNVQALANNGQASEANSIFCSVLDGLNAMVDNGFFGLPMDGFTDPVNDLSLDEFSGRWYQVYAGDFVLASTETNMACIMSDYTKADENTFTIKDSWTNAAKTQAGQGRTGVADEIAPGRMRVRYDGDASCISHGYHVIRTGPVVDGQYDWAVVSDPFAILIRVLARDPQKFSDQYAQEVMTDLSTSFEGLFHNFLPIAQSNCPGRDDTQPSSTSDANTNDADMVAEQQSIPAESTDGGDDLTGLWIALGLLLPLLALLLCLLGFFLYRRRNKEKNAKLAMLPPPKPMDSDSNEKMLKIDESKRCTYCGQGAVCIYGGQLEHDLARKLEASDMGSQMPANTSENRLYPTA